MNFQSSKRKRLEFFEERTLEHFISLQLGHWPEEEEDMEGICRVLAREVAGGEG